MSIALHEIDDGKIVEITASGKLTGQDYEQFVPELDRLIQQHGRVRMVFDMKDFHGWNLGAMWKDFKFGLQHRRDMERVALIGEKRWQKWSSQLCKPFVSGQVHYFDREQADQASSWIKSA